MVHNWLFWMLLASVALPGFILVCSWSQFVQL